MKKIVWEVQYLSAPTVFRYCKKCRKKKPFTCSGQFRVNAQRKSLDIWLIYKCSSCETTWNATVYSRISPQSLKPELLEAFNKNEETLVKQIAMDSDLLLKNGVETGVPLYSVIGETFLPDEDITLEIKSKYSLNIKVSHIVREKLHLSQKDYLRLIDNEKFKSIPASDLRKCKLKKGITLFFQADN